MKIINDSILKAQSGIICHGVNCQKVMNAGLAKQLKNKYFDIYDEYIKFTPKLGEVHFIEVGTFVENRPPLIIANCYTQYYYGKITPYNNAPHHFSYEAFELVCDKVFTFAKEKQYPIHWPRIGCGLAGGSWPKVKAIIESYEQKFDYDSSFLWSQK